MQTNDVTLECTSCGRAAVRMKLPAPTPAQSFGLEKIAGTMGAGDGARALLAALGDPKQLAAAVALTCLACILGQADGAGG